MNDASAGRVVPMKRLATAGRLLLPPLVTLTFVQCAYLGRQATIAYMAVEAARSSDTVRIEIGRSFVEQYKNRVSIAATFTVDEVNGFVNPAPIDGDFHMAGRAPEIGLPMVAEIANASSADDAVALARRAHHEKRALRITGAWRLWPEHARKPAEEQGEPLPPLKSADPSHAFEVHPITRLGDIDLLETLRPVSGYKPGHAERTFGIYEKAGYSLTVTPKRISLTTPTGLYNDVHFIMKVTDDEQVVVPDGRFVMASALALDGKVLVDRLRMVFVKGSPPERIVRTLRAGARLHVYAMPRVSFAEISRRARESAHDPSLLKGKLPYELIVLGVYDDDK